MMYNCRDILLFNKYSAMVGDNEKLMLCYLLSFSSVLPKLLLDKSPYKNVNKITRQIISVQNMGPNFCDLCGSLPLTLCFGKVRIIRSQHHSLNFSTQRTTTTQKARFQATNMAAGNDWDKSTITVNYIFIIISSYVP